MNALPRFEGPADLNVLGEPLQLCSADPLTEFFRTGFCASGPDRSAVHLVCIEANAAFLDFSRSAGNDLTTPMPQWGFPGLQPGDRWCLVAMRWLEAHQAGMAPRVFLRATNQAVLGFIPMAVLKPYALDLN